MFNYSFAMLIIILMNYSFIRGAAYVSHQGPYFLNITISFYYCRYVWLTVGCMIVINAISPYLYISPYPAMLNLAEWVGVSIYFQCRVLENGYKGQTRKYIYV